MNVRTRIVIALYVPFWVLKAALVALYFGVTFPIVMFVAHEYSIGAIWDEAKSEWKRINRYSPPSGL